MRVIRWNPMRGVSGCRPSFGAGSDFRNMQQEVDWFFDRFQGGKADEGQTSTWLPAVDILESEENYLVRVEAPGVAKVDVKITLQENVLTIKGEKKREIEKQGESSRRVERVYGSFQRSLTLPIAVKSDEIEASFDQGVLTIRLPKADEARSKEIEVKVK